jgi:hypothetical protein
MKTLWLSAACVVVCVVTVWCSRITYGQPPKVPEGRRMIAVDDAIVDANEIVFVDETQSEIRIAFRGLPSTGNGSFAILLVQKTPENWRVLSAALGVAIPPRANARAR